MKKIALALALLAAPVSMAGLGSAPAYAQSCPAPVKAHWTYNVDGNIMLGLEFPAYVEAVGGPAGLDFFAAASWLAQHGHDIEVVSRTCGGV